MFSTSSFFESGNTWRGGSEELFICAPFEKIEFRQLKNRDLILRADTVKAESVAQNRKNPQIALGVLSKTIDYRLLSAYQSPESPKPFAGLSIDSTVNLLTARESRPGLMSCPNETIAVPG